MNQEMTLEQLIVNRLANKIGTLEAQLIESQTYNEILVQQNKELKAKLEELKDSSSVEEVEEVPEK